jgi:ribonuclease HI
VTTAQYAVTVRFDGGCQGNPGRKYGSYRIEDEVVVIAEESRFELGRGTNNEAEFETLIRALQNLREISHRTGVDLATTSVRVITDSMIVRNRLMGKNTIHKKAEYRERSEVMFHLARRCLELLAGFHSFRVEWQGREGNVEAFGH